MHKRPENKFEKKLCSELNRRGWSTYHCEAVDCPGFPDIVAFNFKNTILIETKCGTGIRESQRIFARNLWLKSATIVFAVKETGDGWYVLSTVCDKIEFAQSLFSSVEALCAAIVEASK